MSELGDDTEKEALSPKEKVTGAVNAVLALGGMLEHYHNVGSGQEKDLLRSKMPEVKRECEDAGYEYVSRELDVFYLAAVGKKNEIGESSYGAIKVISTLRAMTLLDLWGLEKTADKK
jgi:hypothetical protein